MAQTSSLTTYQTQMETLSNKIVKANKDHACNFCGLKINKGENYHTSFNVDGGEAYTWKSHKDCQRLADIFLEDDNNGEGLTQDDFYTHVFEQYRDIFGKPCSLKTQSYEEILQSVKGSLLGNTHTQDGGQEG